MIKIFIRIYFLLLFLNLGLSRDLFSQNVGIGIANPVRAKLEVNGTAGIGSTSAIFGGDGTGISFQRNWPTIGFNQYRDNTAGNGKYMSNGFAAIQLFDPTTGYMYFDMFSNGSANTHTNLGTRALSISNTGNIGIKANPANASLNVQKGTNFDGAAVFGGTNYSSFFGYAETEDTYIRGGKYYSTVFINDIAYGNVQIGNGSTKVGINTLPFAPATALEINGGLSLRTALSSVANGGTVVVGDRSFIAVYSLTPGYSYIHLSDGLSAGQMLILMGDPANGPLGPFLTDELNLELHDTFFLAPHNTVTLIWTGAKWVELCRSINT